uniref:Non-specific lipid-transfer protein A n=2 Tax=Cajanus cajan TaxID=3821 RepID=A0A151U1Z3_CAJCA|nr:Non-specific lipid-transfer protein A [Cajanus cajan]
MKRVFVAISALLVVFAWTTTATKPAGKGYDCEAAKRSLKPCTDYLSGGFSAGGPPAACCEGVKELKASATTKDERRAACKCIKEAVTHLPNFVQGRAISLPRMCRLDLGFPISKNADCNK